MYAEEQDLIALLEIQHIDLQVMQAKKKRAELPQRIEVMKLRKKREEVQAKLDQVIELQSKAQRELTAIEDEDRSLREKQERAQEIIDAAGSDYRKVESHSKEMAGVAKRREAIAEKELAATEQIEKIRAIRAQLEGAVNASQAEESRLRDAFSSDDQALINLIKELGVRRAKTADGMSPELLALYERTAAKTGGVAVGRLVDDSYCGVCRSSIEGGRLIQLKASAPLGTCPNCKRLLVME